MEADPLLQSALEARRKDHPKLAEWAEVAVTESLTVFDYPHPPLTVRSALECRGRVADPRPGCGLRLVRGPNGNPYWRARQI
jgi:hypothetical protein